MSSTENSSLGTIHVLANETKFRNAWHFFLLFCLIFNGLLFSGAVCACGNKLYNMTVQSNGKESETEKDRYLSVIWPKEKRDFTVNRDNLSKWILNIFFIASNNCESIRSERRKRKKSKLKRHIEQSWNHQNWCTNSRICPRVYQFFSVSSFSVTSREREKSKTRMPLINW